MSKKTRATNKSADNGNQKQVFYEITNNAIVDQKLNKLPKNIKDELNQLDIDSRKKAEKVLPRLLELNLQYPKIPIIYNYITVAYGYIDIVKQEQSIRNNYKNNPNYLFARCHYAQLCLHKGEADKIPGIFDNKFELKALYPRRTLFHTTEYATFTKIMCEYYNCIGDKEKLESLYQSMKQVLPDADETEAVRLLLEPSFFKRLGAKLVSALEQ